MKSAAIVLPPVSALYGAAIKLRLAAYRRGLLNATRLNAPVISVGNLTVGGTGKTPMVEWFCRALARSGRKPCVLTRGYRRENPQSRVLVSDFQGVHSTVGEAGDEAFLLAGNLKGMVAVVSDANRAAAGNWALTELGADVFVLDDGFQHLQLERDLNLLLLDATDPWGGNSLLPVGRLREPLTGLGRADCIVVTRADDPEQVSSLVTDIQGRANCPVLTSQMRVVGVRKLGGEKVDSSLLLQPLFAFCGIGNPQSFLAQIRRSYGNLAGSKSFADHHAFQQHDINDVTAKARSAGATALITTAKDAVKLARLEFSLTCLVLDIEVEIHQEDALLELMRIALSRRQE